MSQGTYIQIRYSNTNDFDNIIFTDNAIQDLFLEGSLGQAKYEYIDFVNRNENNEVTPTKKILEKSIILKTAGGEWLVELLNLISLCDYIRINNKVGELDTVLEMKVEADNKEIGTIIVTFILKRTIWTKCDNNPLQIITCPSSTQDLGLISGANAVIGNNSTTYTTAPFTGSSVGDFFAVITNVAEGTKVIDKYYIYKRIALGWELIIPTIYSRFYNVNGVIPDVYFVLNQNESTDSEYIVTPLPTLSKSILNNGNGTLTALGECIDGYFVRMYESDDGINYTAIGNMVTSSLFNANGLTFTPTAGITYFKLALISTSLTVCLYSLPIHITTGMVKFIVKRSTDNLLLVGATVVLKSNAGATLETLTTGVGGIVYSANLYSYTNYKYEASLVNYISEVDTVFAINEPIEVITISLVPLT